nr:hypothetical protein [Tanacetum cinerariifolium]GEW67413.1 hypothetical protein [Tanacetum cinerariifolium]
MIEEVNQKTIEADIVLQKSINDDVQNKELNCIDEDFQKVRERFSKDVHNEEKMFVKGTHEEKEEEILNQDSIEVNILKVNEADSMAEKSTQDDIRNEYRKNDKKETSFDFKMFDIPKKSTKPISMMKVELHFLKQSLIVHKKKKQSFDRIQTVFRAESEIDVLKKDIKPDIKDASIRVQPKRESSIAWYLKSPFKVRGSVLNNYANTLSQTEVLTADTHSIMNEETDPIEIVYSSCTNNVKIL